MPKQKKHSGAKDRFRITKTGKVMARKSFRNHFLSKKSGSRKRRMSKFNNLTSKIAKKIRHKV